MTKKTTSSTQVKAKSGEIRDDSRIVVEVVLHYIHTNCIQYILFFCSMTFKPIILEQKYALENSYEKREEKKSQRVGMNLD